MKVYSTFGFFFSTCFKTLTVLIRLEQVFLCIFNCTIEEGLEGVDTVSSIQQLAEECTQFLVDVLLVCTELVDSQDLPHDCTSSHTRGVTRMGRYI